MASQYLSQQIDEIITALLLPLDREKQADGWTDQNRRAAVDMFSAVSRSLKYEGRLPPLEIDRSLDQWGVVCGSIFDRARTVANELNALSGNG